MTTRASDADLCERLRFTYSGKLIEPDKARAADRIEALIAERDAAVAQYEATKLRIKWDEAEHKNDMLIAASDALAEGERRATAAIVAWLNDPTGAPYGKGVTYYAAAIERGDHLKKSDPPTT